MSTDLCFTLLSQKGSADDVNKFYYNVSYTLSLFVELQLNLQNTNIYSNWNTNRHSNTQKEIPQHLLHVISSSNDLTIIDLDPEKGCKTCIWGLKLEFSANSQIPESFCVIQSGIPVFKLIVHAKVKILSIIYSPLRCIFPWNTKRHESKDIMTEFRFLCQLFL